MPSPALSSALSTTIACLLVGGCDPSPPARDGSVPDGGVDANASIDGGRDAGPPDAAPPDAAPPDAAPRDGGPLPATCVSPASPDPSGTDAWTDTLGRATVAIDDRGACRRTYTLTSSAALRDGRPDNPRVVPELDSAPSLRSGHDMFDALYALALEETRELSVAAIRDGSFNDGRAVDCGGCFETGRLWNYVWTRDTAYAVQLGMAAADPTRARRSLEFKLSERRGGGDLQVVQDTGTGGSYPVSSDRVAWALGAWELLHHLEGAERDAFAARATEALTNTVEHDRGVVYDPSDGLYFGEQSFLDWREQTYPEWTATNVVHIGMSKALGTNLLHLRALEITASLADEAGDSAARDRYTGWADRLRDAIRARFWIAEDELFSTYVTTTLDPSSARRFDLLGSAFAILFGVADEAQTASILSRYPHYGPGAPVVWPQQQATPIYHNRGEWPFVTAYWLRAAKAGGNTVVADRMIRALVRGAALNLSNMENFEAGSGAPWLDDGADSGPVVNSQRQLWSVAGYLSMVEHTIFGLEPAQDGLYVRPYLSGELRRTLFGGTDEIVLNDYRWRGRTLTVVLHLPADAGDARLEVSSRTLNGTATSGERVDGLRDGANRLDVTLRAGSASAGTLTEVSDADWRDVFGPRTPRITSITSSGGRLHLALSTSEASDVTWTIYRDGAVVADGLAGSTSSWTDPSHDPSSPRTPCYTAETTFTGSGNHSQHAPPTCWWGDGTARVSSIGAAAMTNVGGIGSNNHGRFHYEPWGDPGDSLTVPSFTPTQSGTHLLQVTYGNGAGGLTTGITCGVKRVTVEEAASGTVVARGILVMPHLGEWSRWSESSFVRAELSAGVAYRIVIDGDDTAVNMSTFSHFEAYTGGLGGRSGVFNRVNIAELKILAI